MSRQQCIRRLSICISAVIVSLVAPLAAAADDPPRLEIAGEYAFVHDIDFDQDYPVGWCASIGWGNRFVGVVGEVSGYYRTFTSVNVSVDVKTHTFMAGPKLAAPIGPLKPYVQVLAGFEIYRNTESTISVSISDTRTSFSIQPGAGVDVRLTKSMSARFGGNRRFVKSGAGDRGSLDWTKNYQLVAGIVFSPGQ